MQSLMYLYRMGRGPSSSHTMGPEAAGKRFLSEFPYEYSYKVILYGSLAKTGKGHMTDSILYDVFKNRKISVEFDEKTPTEFHPNTMDIMAFNRQSEIIARK